MARSDTPRRGRRPAIVNISAVRDEATRAALTHIAEQLQVFQGQRGAANDRVVTFRDLVGMDLADAVGSGQYVRSTTIADSGDIAAEETAALPDHAIIVSPFIGGVLVQADPLVHDFVSHWEVFRNADDLVGAAIKIGQTPTGFYFDPHDVPQGFYYWIRAVDTNGNFGPFNKTPGTFATSVDDPAHLLELLRDSLDESQLVQALQTRLDQIDAPDVGLMDRVDVQTITLLEQTIDIDALQVRADQFEISFGDVDARIDGIEAEILEQQDRLSPLKERVVTLQDRATELGQLDLEYLADLDDVKYSDRTQRARLVTEQTIRAEADEAFVNQIAILETNLDDANALIVSEQTARSDADSALASDLSILAARVTVNEDDVAAAIGSASDAQATADGKVTTFFADAAPTAEGVGDLWIDTDGGNQLYRWDGAEWVDTQDTAIGQAIADAASAQATADGKIVSFYQDDEPTAAAIGDLWFDTDDGNRSYRWNGTAWIDTRDAGISENLALIQTEQTARADGDSALAEQAATILTRVGDAEAYIQQVDTALTTETDARVSQTTALQASVDDNAALIASETTARTDADTAISDSISLLSARVGDNESAIVTEQTTRADADSAQATQISGLTTRVDDAEAAIVAEQTARSDADEAQATTVAGIEARVTTAETDLSDAEAAIVQAQEDLLINAQGVADALENAATAQATADGKITTHFQDAAPSTADLGDIWYDTDNGNAPYRWDGSEWIDAHDAAIDQATLDAATAQATADGKIVSFFQPGPPTAGATGDLWFDTDDTNKPYRWNGSQWVSVADPRITSAIGQAATAQATADGKITAFYQDDEPAGADEGDLWVDTNDGNLLYRLEGSTWISIRDTGIATALQNAAGAQETADGKIVSFFQDTEPTAEGVGDIWFDTDNSNRPYRWNGSGWVSAEDPRIASAVSQAATAQATADGKITAFYQGAEPSGADEGDLWVDTDNGNLLYRLEGSTWISIRDTGIAAALADAAGAQETADGKIVSFFQDTEPTAAAQGDLWFDTDDDNHPYRWNGTTWVSSRDQQVISNTARITTEEDARADLEIAVASHRTELLAFRSVDGVLGGEALAGIADDDESRRESRLATAQIVNEQTVRADADSALAQSITTLTARLGDAEATITTLSVTGTIDDEAFAEQVNRIEALSNENEAAILAEQTARANADSAFTTALTALTARTTAAESAIVQEQQARASADAAQASNVSALSVRVTTAEDLIDGLTESTSAAILAEQTVRADADSAFAEEIGLLTARTTAAEGAITTEQTARADADAAEVSARELLAARVTTNEGAITTNEGDLTALTGRVTTTESAIATEQTVRADADTALADATTTLAARVTTNEGDLATTSAAITDIQSAQAGFESAQATHITQLEAFAVVQDNLGEQALDYLAQADENGSLIRTERTVRSDADEAFAADILALQSTTSDHTAAILAEQTVRADTDNAISQSITTLQARTDATEDGIDDVVASVQVEQTARTNADTALSESITTLSARVDTNEDGVADAAAALVVEQQARADGDSAVAQTVTTLTARVATNEGDLLQAFEDIGDVAAIADGKVEVYYQPEAPASADDGDLWFDTDDDNHLYHWDVDQWVDTNDPRISAALSQAISAQDTADGKATLYYENAEPAGANTGDLWFDTDDGNHPYRWDGAAWGSIRDAGIAAALQAASGAQATADGKINVFYQAEPPTGVDESEGDLWFDTNDGNQLYRLEGASWTSVQDAGIATAIQTATDAAAAVDGKATVYYRPHQPTLIAEEGDLWIVTDQGNLLRVYSNGSWRGAADARLPIVVASLEEFQNTYADESSALAETITTLTTAVDDNASELTILGDSVDGISAQYTVKIDNNGHVSGFGLASRPVDDDPANGFTSEFAIVANRFLIANPGTGDLQPFAIEDGNVLIDSAVIGTASISSAQIASLNAAKLETQTLSAVTAKLGFVQATGGITTGELVLGNQTFGTGDDAVTVSRATGFANSGTRLEISRESVYPLWYGTGPKNDENGNFWVDQHGNVKIRNAELVDITASGHIEATSLKADAVAVVNTLHLANNAVTLPKYVYLPGEQTYGIDTRNQWSKITEIEFDDTYNQPVLLTVSLTTEIDNTTGGANLELGLFVDELSTPARIWNEFFDEGQLCFNMVHQFTPGFHTIELWIKQAGVVDYRIRNISLTGVLLRK